jgi:Methyltransferase domain
VLEIGFGARPYRLFALHAFGVDALGVDLDQPVLRSRDVMAAFRVNGLERAAKSAIRYFLFDLAENGQLAQFLARVSGRPFKAPLDCLVVADAADQAF